MKNIIIGALTLALWSTWREKRDAQAAYYLAQQNNTSLQDAIIALAAMTPDQREQTMQAAQNLLNGAVI